MMIETFIKKWWFVLLYLAVYFVAINLVALNRMWQFETYYFDHSIFDSALWQVAHGRLPYIDHLGPRPELQLGDHFTPFLYLLAPLYWFTSAYEPILVLQNIFFIGSAVVLFFIAKRHIANRLMVFALILAYTLFIGTQNTLIANFHTELPAMLTLALALYAMDRKKWLWYWPFFLLTLGLKETFVGIFVGLGLYLFLQKEKAQGAATIVLAIGYYFLATHVVIPAFSGQSYGYKMNQPTVIEMVKGMVTPAKKFETMAVSFSTFGFLPLASLAFLPAIFQDFFVRFVLVSSDARIDLGLHYNAMLAVLLTYGSILGVQALSKFKWYKKVIIFHALAIIAIVLYFHRVRYHGPLGLAYNPAFYAHTQDLNFLRDFIKKVPSDGKVMAPNNLAAQMTHTHDVMLLRADYWQYPAKYIVMDRRAGQSPNNYWPLDPFHFGEIQDLLKKYRDYDLIYNQGDLYIYQWMRPGIRD